MNRKEAIDLLMALAVCSVVDLSCEDCPLLNHNPTEEPPYCEAWTEEKITEAVNFFKENPIEAEPVRHGKWIIKNNPILDPKGYFIRIVCSECNLHTGQKSNYCPQCGAKMDKEEA